MRLKSKIVLLAFGFLAILGIIGHAVSPHSQVAGVQTTAPTATPTLTPTNTPTPTDTPTLTPTPTVTIHSQTTQQQIQQPKPTATTDNLSNNNYYSNSDGNQVHSPAYTTDNSIPAGATAKCADGTYSFSQHHSGTCSHHGGVEQWY
jgi:hypothetical protein